MSKHKYTREERRQAVEVLLTRAGGGLMGDITASPIPFDLAFYAWEATDTSDLTSLEEDAARAARWVAAGWSPGDPPLDADPPDDLDMLELIGVLDRWSADERRKVAMNLRGAGWRFSHDGSVLASHVLVHLFSLDPSLPAGDRMDRAADLLLSGWCPP